VLFGQPLLGQPAAALELVQERGNLGGVGIGAVQLARQLEARMLAAREQPQRPGAQTELGGRANRDG
jgi:hypothetical protein